MPDDIVLIGPVRAGKSTIGRLLAGRLQYPQVSLDEVRWKYYAEIGYDAEVARTIRAQGGFLALVYYRNLFAAYAVERMLGEHHDCVFDFGAGIYESHESFRRVQRALSDYPNVILLLPSPDRLEALKILKERDAHPPQDLTFDISAYFFQHHTYYDLAKLTFYTKDKAPEETCAEILDCLGSPGKYRPSGDSGTVPP
ncbi:MAG TPA: shikimate kinase [Anaerolineales bacterium]|nr:shikimate kinase [Anaerolineales bacterium]